MATTIRTILVHSRLTLDDPAHFATTTRTWTSKANIVNSHMPVMTAHANLRLSNPGWDTLTNYLPALANVRNVAAVKTSLVKANLRSIVSRTIAGKTRIKHSPLEYWFYLTGADSAVAGGDPNPLWLAQDLQSIALTANYSIDFTDMCEWRWEATNNYGELIGSYTEVLLDISPGTEYFLKANPDHIVPSPNHIVLDTEVVKNAQTGVLYYITADYTMDYTDAQITPVIGGGVPAGACLEVSYDFVTYVSHTDIVANVVLDTAYQLRDPIVSATELVTNVDTGAPYVITTDYIMDYTAGTIKPITGGNILAGSDIQVVYDFITEVAGCLWEDVTGILNSEKTHFIFRRHRDDGELKTVLNGFGLRVRVVTTGATLKLFDYAVEFDYGAPGMMLAGGLQVFREMTAGYKIAP